MNQPDIDICSECGEHTEFGYFDEDGNLMDESHPDFDNGECVSTCCGAGPYDTDPDIDMER